MNFDVERQFNEKTHAFDMRKLSLFLMSSDKIDEKAEKIQAADEKVKTMQGNSNKRLGILPFLLSMDKNQW